MTVYEKLLRHENIFLISFALLDNLMRISLKSHVKKKNILMQDRYEQWEKLVRTFRKVHLQSWKLFFP